MRGLHVRLLPVQYVRPYVRRNKTDRTDTEALLEAARCGGIQPVPVKSVEQQTLQALHHGDRDRVFFLNGKPFDVNRIDFEATLGDVEEWTLVNDTDERHTFHIHQIDYLVTQINGDDEDTTGLRDNIDVLFRDPVTKVPGSVTVILPFTDPVIVGKFLFHCHISEHSNKEMMGNMLIRPRRSGNAK